MGDAGWQESEDNNLTRPISGRWLFSDPLHWLGYMNSLYFNYSIVSISDETPNFSNSFLAEFIQLAVL